MDGIFFTLYFVSVLLGVGEELVLGVFFVGFWFWF